MSKSEGSVYVVEEQVEFGNWVALSVWTTREKAEAEVARLQKAGRVGLPLADDWQAVEFKLDDRGSRL